MNNQYSPSYNKLIEYALKIISRKRYTDREMREKLGSFIGKRKILFAKLEEGEASVEISAEMENSDELKSAMIPERRTELIEQVMDRLKELRYIDDQRYAEDYVAQRVKLRPRGRFLLKRELRSKGINEEVVDKVIQDAGVDEFEMAMRLLEKRKKQWEDLPFNKRKNKSFQYLAARGINKDAIYRAVESCYN